MAEKENPPIGKIPRDKVKEILLVLVHSVSAAKLFPCDHQMVVNFISDLFERLKKYLDAHWKLELGIGEYAFILEGEVIYEDIHPVRSLPFFFYKDGMQKLYFYKGLTREELREFLETIRTVSQLPPEEGDIVNALWEKDFPNIRYLAPDDFLETRIGVDRPLLRPFVDKAGLCQGRIELAPEDLEEMRSAIISLKKGAGQDDRTTGFSVPEYPLVQTAAFEDGDLDAIETLLQSSRQVSADDEYLNLIVELIYLEDRWEQFPVIAEVLEKYYLDIIERKDFSKAAALVRALSEVGKRFVKKDERKAELIGSIVSQISRMSVLSDLQTSLDLASIEDMDGLFSYLELFGPQAAGFIADIFEQIRRPEWREQALEMLTKIGQDDIQTLGGLIQESRPALSQEIIRLLKESQDKRAVAQLAHVMSYKNPVIKQAAVRALGAINEEAAGKILLGFLSDPDDEIRIAVLDNLKKSEDKQVIFHIIGLISEKKFFKKAPREKQALFDFLGRSDSGEACAFLAEILRKVPFLPNPKHTELCLYAVSALTKMKNPTSLDILKKGSKRRNWKIRSACLRALNVRSEIPVTFTGRIPQ